MNADAEFVLLVIAGGLVLYFVGHFLNAQGRKRMISELSGVNARNAIVSVVSLYIGFNTLWFNLPPDTAADPLVAWGYPVLGAWMILFGLWMLILMAKSHFSGHTPKDTSN